MKRFINAALLLVLGVAIVNISLAAKYFSLRRAVSSNAEHPVSMPKLSGFTLQNEHWIAPEGSCSLVRLTEDACPHCKADQPFYQSLLAKARQSGCQIVEVAPHAGAMAENSRSGVVQLQYLDMDLGVAVLPYGTPQTFVVDASWNVVWKRHGELNLSATMQATEAVTALTEKN